MLFACLKPSSSVRFAVTLFLMLCILVEGVYVAKQMNAPEKKAARGFLSKSAHGYIVAWKGDLDTQFEMENLDSLESAVNFYQKKLGLAPVESIDRVLNLERVWVSDRFGTYVLLWKHWNDAFVRQITFERKTDADYFANLFRKGAYSPSLNGNAILLRRSAS